MKKESAAEAARARLCSIVIPVFNCAHYTRQCLEGIRAHTADVPHEIIVVDNGSSDETPAVLAERPDVRVIRNERNQGFAIACNQGARAANGEHLLFLNNDTIPQPNWLAKMVEVLRRDASIGIVGSKLLYPQNDLIQHAGVDFNGKGVPIHLFRFCPSDFPEANISRRVPVVTGASLLMRTRQCLDFGGFDEAYLNGYEDVDLCLRVGQAGLGVYYCHESLLYHFESMTPGRADRDSANCKLLRERWNDYLAAHGRPDWSQAWRDGLAKYGDSLFKLKADRNSNVWYVLMRGDTLFRCDKLPLEVVKFTTRRERELARFLMGTRYLYSRLQLRWRGHGRGEERRLPRAA